MARSPRNRSAVRAPVALTPRAVAALAAGVIGASALVAYPSMAAADERKSPLEGQPAVRHRKLLVRHRLELTPTFESSINADYRHTLAGGAKAEFHLSDMWSIGAIGLFGTSVDTGLTDRVVTTLPPDQNGTPEPTRTQFEEHLNSMPVHGAGYVSLTPWYGKLAAFGSLFVNFDFYFQAGVSFAMLENECCTFPNVDDNPEGDPSRQDFPDNDPRNDPALNDGSRLGVYGGGGIHLFFNDWLALDLSFRDYFFSDNPSGLDYNADLAVTEDDSRLLHHFSAGVGLSVFFPTAVDRTP